MKLFFKRAIAALLTVTTLSGTFALLSSCTKKDSNVPGDHSSENISNNTPTDRPTPLDPSLYEDNPLLEIVELMATNEIGITADDGNRYPWIELYAKADLKLSDYSLMYADKTPVQLPSADLKAGELYLLFVGKDGFEMSLDSSAMLTLMHGDRVSQSFVYINRGTNCSYLVKDACETTKPTPGYENVLEADKLIISELMCDNSKYPVDGAIGDWIELYNAGDTDILLSNYWISDKLDTPYLCKLPEISLKAGEYTVLRADKELNFGLSQNGETVYLTRLDGVVSSMVVYTVFDKNLSYTQSGTSDTPTPGYPNTKEGMLSYIFDRGGLLINEVISSNSKYQKLSGEYYDIVELYNSSSEAINLGDYYLTDKAKELMRYKLPDVTLESGKYYLVYCTGDGGDYPDFGISTDGETILLTKSDGYVCDSLTVPFLPHNVSYGRANKKLLYFDTPTLGSLNKTGYEEIASTPTASVNSGNYDSAVNVTLHGDGNIYYTTDGTKPSLSSTLYKGETLTFDKTGSIRMFCAKNNCITSPEVSYSYAVNIVDHTLPMILVAVDNDDMFGTNGVFNTSEKTELNARVSYFIEGNEEFSVGCGIKIFGGMTRYYKKKSFQLKFRGQYGTSELEYKMFDDLDITSFNSLVLRAGGQSLLNSIINDELGTSLASTSGNMTSLLVQSYKPVNLYINDTYMGIYFLREKIDEEFVASHLGVSPESVTVIDYMKVVKYGKDDAGWAELWKYVNEKDLTVKENYEYILSKFDIDSIIDFYIMEMWANNTDTGNVRVARSTEGDGKWRFILFDMDLSNTSSYSGAQTYLAEYHHSTKPYNSLIWKLLQNDEFYEYFVQRFDMHLSSTLSTDTVNARIDFIYSQLIGDIKYEIERWNIHNSNYNQTVSEWQQHIRSLRSRRATDTYIARFRQEVLDHAAAIRKS